MALDNVREWHNISIYSTFGVAQDRTVGSNCGNSCELKRAFSPLPVPNSKKTTAKGDRKQEKRLCNNL